MPANPQFPWTVSLRNQVSTGALIRSTNAGSHLDHACRLVKIQHGRVLPKVELVTLIFQLFCVYPPVQVVVTIGGMALETRPSISSAIPANEVEVRWPGGSITLLWMCPPASFLPFAKCRSPQK